MVCECLTFLQVATEVALVEIEACRLRAYCNLVMMYKRLVGDWGANLGSGLEFTFALIHPFSQHLTLLYTILQFIMDTFVFFSPFLPHSPQWVECICSSRSRDPEPLIDLIWLFFLRLYPRLHHNHHLNDCSHDHNGYKSVKIIRVLHLHCLSPLEDSIQERLSLQIQWRACQINT